MMKTCKTCNKNKLVTEFSKHPLTKDRMQPNCKSCVHDYNQEYKLSGKRRQTYVKYYNTEVGKESKRKQRISYKKRNPIKHKCRWIVWNGIKLGSINRPNNCSQCNEFCIPEAHHKDYNKPLEIEWLCKECHMER